MSGTDWTGPRASRPRLPPVAATDGGLVDLHTHLLPGVDDGVRTLDEALAQLRAARDQGITALACTPHTHPVPPGRLEPLLAERRGVHERVVAAAEAEGGLPQIGLGAEVLIIDENVSLDPPGMRINGGMYALVEVPFGLQDFSWVREVFLRLLDRGHVPVLAHVERYARLLGYDPLDIWRGDGVLAQVNASSLVGEHGEEIRRRALDLIDTGRADLVASDVHGDHMRRNHLAPAHELVLERADPHLARSLFVDVPRAIFESRQLGGTAREPRPDSPSGARAE